MDAPEENYLDELGRPREVLNSCREHSGNADYGCSTVNGKKKKARKPTLKVEFGWKHYIGGTFVHIKKGRGEGNQRVSMKRSATYQECLSKATELFFPNSCNQFGTLSDMETPHLATYNNSYKINEEGFTVESFKKTTGMTLPRLYLETKAKEQTNSRPQWKSPSCDTSYTTEVNNVGSSSPSEGDSGLQDRSCDTDQVSSDLDSMQLMSLFGNPNLSLMNIVNGQFPNTEIEPASTVQQGHVGTDCSGNSHTKDTCSRLTTAADVNTMSQDTCTSQHYDLDHSVVQRHTHPSGSLETNHSISPEGPSAPGSDLSTVHRDGVHYTGVSGSVQRIVPQEGRTEGGYPFEIFFSEPLPEDVTSGKAYFCHEPVGIAELTKLGPCLFHGIVPESPRPDVVPVTVITQTGLPLGITYFKYIDKEYSVAMEILNGDVNLQKLLNIIAKTPDCSNQTKQQHSVQFLQLLVYTASQTGEKGLIEIIFSTSAGKIVFDSYKDRTPLPEDVARANGHDHLANYLQDLTTRLSKEPELSLKEAHVIDWSELEAAVTAAQTQGCLSEEKSSDDSSENNSDTDYFADVETSSIELSNSKDNTSKLYCRTLLYGTMVKIGQIREGVKQKSSGLILRHSHFDSSLPEVVKGLDYTLAFHLAMESKNIPRHLHTANERFLASRERIMRQPTISFHIFADLCSQISIEKAIPMEWKSSNISVEQFDGDTNSELWVFTSAFQPTRKTLFVFFADRRDALPHNYFFEDEDCESQIRCWKWKKRGNSSLKLSERLKAGNRPPASSGQSAWNRNYPMGEADFYEKRLADDIGPQWKDLERALGFHQTSIEDIQQEKGNSKECCKELLVPWLHQKGKGVTAGKLAEGLMKIGRKNLADRFPIKPSDTNQNSKENSKARGLEDTVFKMSNRNKELEEKFFKMSNRNKELEEEVSKLRAINEELQDGEKQEVEVFKMSTRIKELEEEVSKIKELEEEVSKLRAVNEELQDGEKQEVEDLDDKCSIDMNAYDVSEETDEEARERRISEKLRKYNRQLETYVTPVLEVPEIKQDQLKTPVTLDILKTVSEYLEELYIATQDMVSETCKCSEDLKRDFYDFAYHRLHTDHNELVHRVEDLEDTVQEMGEEEKEKLQKLKEFQGNRQSLIKELEEKWRPLYSMPEHLPKNRWSADITGRGKRSTDNRKVKSNTDLGARPKERNVQDKRLQDPKPLSRIKKTLKFFRLGKIRYQRLKES